MPLPSAPSQSTRRTVTLQIESAVIDCVKEDASRFMNLFLFQSSLYPSTNEVDKLAIAALKCAIGKHPKNGGELKEWKSSTEGQKFLSRLKGNVRKIHKDCSQGCAWGLFSSYLIFTSEYYLACRNILQMENTAMLEEWLVLRYRFSHSRKRGVLWGIERGNELKEFYGLLDCLHDFLVTLLNSRHCNMEAPPVDMDLGTP
ncbi:uncharacterized protein F5147DRAFT_653987 [Suillus discolor]|uniref:Uncharacterized protein n=1 Tax=Suillus discolor TaxID=1912936 RepID=A0A9P7JSW3_9AGAM|nr:uncharacterized protein F5147DRAFT_653987 [Suillus discolor]KAG2106242.1 hypothetical protein F5147DRAFT_653987 [Suillus discolor]